MSKNMSCEELKVHCEEAVKGIKDLLDEFSQSNMPKMVKRAMLIAYWVKTYVQYIKKEDRFSPESVYRLKRGSVVRVEFGYRIGRELGGRHYAVVIDVDNSMYRNTVTVVPLGSVKEGAKDDKNKVLLGEGVFVPVQKKTSALIEVANDTLRDAKAMEAEIEAAENEKKSILRAVQRQKIDDAKKLIEQVKSWFEEIEHMKPGSVAMVDQITTISKMRISQPLKKTHPLYGIRLSTDDMDKIDERLKKLYFQK